MCHRIKRNPFVSKYAATFLGDFIANDFEGGYDRDSQWLVFKFESEDTLVSRTTSFRAFARLSSTET